MKNVFFSILEAIKKSPLGKKGLSRVFPFSLLYDLFIKITRINCMELEGQKIYFDARSAYFVVKDGYYEPYETAVVRKYVNPGAVVLDIGANIGYYTLICAGLAGPSGRVYSFEPAPENFALLEKNVKNNGYQNVILEQKAVSDRPGSMELFLSGENMGDHQIYKTSGRPARKSIKIKAITIDDYMKEKGKADFIKMDIQGAETAAVAGMRKFLNENRGVKMMMEFWPAGFKNFGSDPEIFLEMMGRMGFKFYDIISCTEDGKWEPSKAQDYINKYTPENDKHTNILFTRDVI